MRDYTEHHDLIKNESYVAIIKQMRERWMELNNSTFSPNRGKVDMRCCDQIEVNNGFWGPWLNESRNNVY
eukprot:UN12971